jgi:integral membrane protein
MTSETTTRPVNQGALLRYRIAAIITGIVLRSGTIMLILKDVAHVHHMEPATGLVWLFHGWFFFVYVIITFLLGLNLRWPLWKYAVVMIAGTIPTMSFVAEHYVTREARSRMSS